MNAKILSTGSYIPSRSVNNAQLYQKIANFDIEKARVSLHKKGLSVEHATSESIFDLWVQRVSGVKSRPFVDEEFSKQAGKKTEVELMGFFAAQKAIEKADLDKKDIDQVIFSTYSSNRIMPSAACSLIHSLELKNASALTLNGACSGFLDGLIDAVIRIRAGYCRTVLVVAAEQLSNKMDYDDPKTAIIFSDGAGAVVVQATEDDDPSGVLGFDSDVIYSEQVYMERRGPIFFNSGPLVERNAVRTMLNISERALSKSKVSFSEIDFIIPHQANIRIIDHFERSIKKSYPETSSIHMVRCIENYGNLSSATIPVALDLFIRGVIDKTKYRKDSLFLLSSVGGGYTFSGLVIRL